jgi:LysM repeat protein
MQSGDTLSGIAQSFSIPLSNLLAANDLSQRAILRPGEQLIIPDPQTAPATSDQTTLSQNVKSALNLATPTPPTTNQPVNSLLSARPPAFDASNFVTRDQFNAAMTALGSSVEQLLAVSQASRPNISRVLRANIASAREWSDACGSSKTTPSSNSSPPGGMSSDLRNCSDQIPQAHRFDDSMNFEASLQLAKHAGDRYRKRLLSSWCRPHAPPRLSSPYRPVFWLLGLTDPPSVYRHT